MCLPHDTGGILTHNCSDLGFNSYRELVRLHLWVSVGVGPRSRQKWGQKPCRHHSFPLITVSSSEIICNANFPIEVQKISSEKSHHWRTVLQSFNRFFGGWETTSPIHMGLIMMAAQVCNKITSWPQSVFLKHLQRLMKFPGTVNTLR